MSSPTHSASSLNRQVFEMTARLIVFLALLSWCFEIVRPFINLVIWGGVMAVAIYPLFAGLSKRLGNRPKTAIATITLVGIAIVLLPVIAVSDSIVETAQEVSADVEAGTFEVEPPPDKVAEWPVIGERVHGVWSLAAANLQEFVHKYQPQMRAFTAKIFGALASAGGSVLQFVLALLVMALLLASADGCRAGAVLLADRLVPEGDGHELVALSTATIRSVATGVLGVAFIQAMLAALGLFWVGAPAPGLVALAVLLLAIVQLPPILALLPVAIWVFGSAESPTVAWIFLVYCVLVSFSDMVLKPMLLGRGVDVPMPVILIGAIGGMISSGIIGLFVGAVILAFGYRLLSAWLHGEIEEPESTGEVEAAAT